MSARQTRNSTRLALAKQQPATAATSKPELVVVVNRTTARNSRAAAAIASDSEPDSDAEANIENVNQNRGAQATRGKRPPPSQAASKTMTKTEAALAKAVTKTPTKRKSAKPVPQPEAESSGQSDSENEETKTVSALRPKDEPTPPKQSKFASGGGEHKLSPVMLLDKLTLTSPSRKTTTTATSATTTPPMSAAESASRSKYQNARITLNSAETYSLPGREPELAELSAFLADGLRLQKSASMYISGPPGTGKTASLSKLLNASEFSAKFQRVYVNCTSIASIGSIYKKVCAELRLRVGTEKECLASIEQYLAGKHRTLLMVLDEVDQLVGKKQSVLYTIFEWPAKPHSNMLLIGIANSLDLTDRCLSRLHAKCELKPRLMHFAPYTKEQIVSIFKARLLEAGVLDIFPPVTLQLLAAKVASISGDVRRALDIGRRVIEMAEEQRRGAGNLDLAQLGIGELASASDAATKAPAAVEKVEIKQVMQVLNQVYGASQTLGDDLDETFPLQQKILICTLLLILRCDKNKDITVGRLHGVYAKVCSVRHIQPVGRNEFTGLCELVETRGIVRMIKNKEPRLCKVQMQWDEQEVTQALQDKQMIASILADTACVKAGGK